MPVKIKTQLFARAQCKAIDDNNELIQELATAIYNGKKPASEALKAMYESGFVSGGRAVRAIMIRT